MRLLLSALAAIILSACASTPSASEYTGSGVDDPFEGFNRQMFALNNNIDKYALGPTAKVYETVTPRFARDRAGDAIANLSSPVTFTNDILQAKPERASDTMFRFLINSTVGVLGLWDAADYFGLSGHKEDFGQTLAVWGVESGPFLVMPVIGPTTPRDLVGAGVNRAMDPLMYIEFAGQPDLDTDIQIARTTIGALNGRLALEDQLEALMSQPEPYIALRRIYINQREADIRDGKIDEETAYDDLPDFDEFTE